MITTPSVDLVECLTPRQVEVVCLIGGEGLSYKAAAARLENKIIRARPGVTQPKLSHRTVRQYAKGIRDIIGSDLSPIRALTVFYYQHRDVLE